ncbi:MAG: CheR family methyltransferase, partial [Planctomycetota bacterium]
MASTADEPETIASAAEPSVPFPVVGIGASAGGLEAISALLAAVRFDSMAFVVIQHLAPKHESMLPEILGRATTMPVVAITDGMKIEKNRVHVAPAGVDVTIQRGVFETSADAPGSAPHHSIDVFLRALALDQRQSAIGIVLSGTGTDGTLGLRAIKAEGGVVFVQDPASAKYPGMPQSALDAGGMDFKGSPEAIARELTTISTHPYLALRAAPLVPSPDLLERIFTLLRATFGNDLTHYKQGTLLRRIERRMALLGCNTLENYVKVLETAPLEPTLLYRDMLINVTSFFRDKEPFDVLKTVVFPRMLAAKRPGDPIRIWSAGCSTGEEPYSLAMTLLEHLGSRAQEYKLQVFGTDVDDDAVQKARRGVYPETISLDVSEERLLRWFTRVNRSYQVTQGVRDKVIFATQNVLQDAPFSRLDLIACRNVMIYLQPRLQKKVLRIFNYALQPEGCLLLGSSETVGDAVDLFGSLDKKNKIYFKKNVGAAPQILDVAAGSFTRGQGDPRPARPVGRVPATLEQLADRAIIESYGPPGVVLDLNLNVVQFRGWTGDYLESPPGTATFNILKLARPELMFVLRPAIQQSVRDDAPVTVPAVSFRTGDGERTIALKVVPIHVHGDGRVGSLVLFEEPTRDEASPARVAQGTAPNAGESDLAESNRRLEQELGATKNYLQVTVEDLEAANEELQSANEELQSANEEL